MLVVRFKETFRDRVVEWALAAGMVAWGLLAIAATNLFAVQEFFHPLLHIMSQDVWGTSVLIVGIVRLVFLVINGAWRPSAHIRAIGCVLGTMLWGSLLLSALNLDWMTPTTSLYAILFSLDLVSLWFSAGDAKLADLSAKGKLKAV